MNPSERRPLERISLYGYKSIRELKNLRLGEGLNILIGANGSGKSNFIRFFELLGHMMDPDRGLQNYIAEHGGADAFLFRGMKETPELKANLTFGLNQYNFTLRGASDRSMFFAQESAPFKGPIFGPVENSQGSGHKESVLSKKQSTKAEKWVVNNIRNWRLYHFHDTSSQAPVMGTCNIVDNDVLHPNAANISAFLMKLKDEHPNQYLQIEEAVRQVAPFFGTFILKEVTRGKTQLLWKDRHSDLTFYPHQLSDGTMRFICLATLLLQPNPAWTIVIDEPELGLHPQAVKLLAGMLYEAAERAQLVVATQSSMLLDEVRPEEVIVANHKNGETRLRRLNPSDLAEWLKEYTLGQLWEKNEFGGQP